MSTRRDFFATTAAAGIAAAPLAAAPNGAPLPLKLGVASYSLREFSRNLAIKMTKKLGVSYINIKEFHLLYKATPEEREKGRKQFEAAGLTITGGGTINLLNEDPADVRYYFDYAKQCGMPLMVIHASPKTLPVIEKHVKEYNIKVAVHNHGPEDKNFPKPTDAMKYIKDMDPRVGLCVDIGHTTRTGADLMEELTAVGPRLLDMHIKDLKDIRDGKTQCPVGDGSFDIPGIFAYLKKINYQGGVMLEYEIEGDDPFLGMAKSFSYMRGVLAGMKA
ncbi:MAG: sugar phosphate isomerase/epimerase [Bryobacteraceae bacterium]|nr:sugar phosphate isomerase/epimerase [Bryobacteraceae bacterium]